MSEGENRIACKLYRIFMNESYLDSFPRSMGLFHPCGLSYHCPCALFRGDNTAKRKSPFKFFNFWADYEKFLPLVEKVWKGKIHGNPKYCLVNKLKKVKLSSKELNKKEFWNISESVKIARERLNSAQMKLQRSPLDDDLLEEEKERAREY